MQANLKFARPLAVAFGLFALGGTAYAADVVQEEPPAPAPVAELPVASWAGPYAGLSVGYGFSGHAKATDVGVDVGSEIRFENWEKVLGESAAAGHPLEIVAVAVVIRPVKLAARKSRLEPAEQSLVAYVHAQGDLRLTPITTEVALADEDPEQQAALEVRKVGGAHASIVSP